MSFPESSCSIRLRRFFGSPVFWTLSWLSVASWCFGGCSREETSPPSLHGSTQDPGSEAPGESLDLARVDSTGENGETAGPGSVDFDFEGAGGGATGDGQYYVAYRVKEEEIELNELFTLDVVIVNSNEDRREVPDVEIEVDARMPAHRHGMSTEPKVRRTGESRFEVEGMMFHMLGHWALTVDVSQKGVTERAQFDLELE